MKNRVFAFGDKISPGKQTDVFVAFNVDDIPGGMLSGPFDDRVQAEEEAYDIKSYEHVFNVRIVTRADMKIKIHRRKSEKEKHVAETAEIAPKHDD